MSKKFTVILGLILCLLCWTTVATADDPTVGPINPATSIIGEAEGDSIGAGGIRILPSGNLVIASPSWGGNRGAVTCITPADYQAGGVVVTAANSLVGGAIDNRVGASITILSNGDYVVVSPQWDDGVNNNVGAITWVNGDTCIPFNESTRNATVSATNSIVGSTTNDGTSLKVYALSNGRYSVVFPEWDNGAVTNAGGVRGCVSTTGCAGVLTAANALVGSIATDRVGATGITVLSDGDYVVQSRFWNTGRGAATWCKGTVGCKGTISASNSLVGSTENDWVGSAVTALPLNGNYVTQASWWSSPTVQYAGATTWCNGTNGCVGEVSASNSLIGSTGQDMNGSIGAIALANGNYIMRFTSWDNGATTNVGAVVWCDGTIGCEGVISPSNALVGATANDILGDQIYFLTNGNFVVASAFWDNGAAVNAGAAVWCNGATGCKGVVSTSNALYGSTTNDELGFRGTPLSNGNFVIATSKWDNPDTSTVDVGAVTFMNGTTGLVGPISTTNSLVGTQANDKVGSQIYQLTNGNYVVTSVEWNNGAITRAGAATWINGATGFQGTVSTANSLVGGFNDALIGNAGVTALSNGNYVVKSMAWGYGDNTNHGAVTWGDGATGTTGIVDETNSVVGSNASDQLGLHGITALPNGHYLIQATWWSNGGATPYTGAIRWANGEIPTSGGIDATNSIVGNTNGDEVGQVLLLPNGDYIVYAQGWDNGATFNAGAIRRGSSTTPTIGAMDNSNALLGTLTNELTGATFIIRPDNSFFISIPNWDNATGVVVYSPGPENLLKNPSFETASSPTKYAAQWKSNIAGYTAADKRLCDKPAKPVTRTNGSCVFQFNSASTPLKTRTLKQTITNPVWGTAGNVLTLTADVEGLKVGGGAKKIILNIKYDNNTIDKATLTIPAGTYDYTTLLGTVNLTRTVKTVIVTVNVGKATGRIRVDNLFLSVSAAPVLRFPSLGENTTRDGASTFDAPAAPDGFRH